MTDILASIDDAIGERCACGCGEPVPPDGASAWFASQACQWRWNQRQASNPAEVYNGPNVTMLDAAERNAAPAWTDPAAIPLERLRAAYDALGLHPDGWRLTRSIHLTPHEVTVTRHAADHTGHTHLGPDGEVVTQSVGIPVGDPVGTATFRVDNRSARWISAPPTRPSIWTWTETERR